MGRFGVNGMVAHTILWRDCNLRGTENGKANSDQVRTCSVKSQKMSADVGKAVTARFK